MKIRPILFQTPMVQAIQAGLKTQTRRAIKPQPIDDTENSGMVFSGDHNHAYKNDIFHQRWQERFVELCPYGQVGDVLYVRETWQPFYLAGDTQYVFRADTDVDKELLNGSWKPSLFMPKVAARIFLEINSVRAERLQDISEFDAEMEGVARCQVTTACSGADVSLRFQNYLQRHNIYHPLHRWVYTAKCSYETLWEKINGRGSWAANPFVWVISFKQIDKPQQFQ